MQILFLVESVCVSYGGTGLAAQQLAQALAPQGVQVGVHLLRDEQPVWPRVSHANLRWSVVPSAFLGRWRYFWQLGRDSNATVVHIHGIWNLWWAVLAQILTWRQIPFVVSPHGSLEPGALQFSRLKKRVALAIYQRRALRQASALVVTSSLEAQGLAALCLGVPVCLVPNGVALETPLLPTTVDQGEKSDSPRTFLFLSRIHPKKGLPLLVRAWSRVRQPGWRVVVAGNDEQGHLAEVKALALALGVLDDFHFPGAVQGAAKQRLFAQADVFVLPTRSENFGIVVAEALSHGVPVITTRGAPWGGLTEKGCGWWCDIDESALAVCMEQAMQQPKQTLAAMGAAGREWVRRDFNWDFIAQRALAELYRPTLGVKADLLTTSSTEIRP